MLSEQVCSHFVELWLAWNHGGGITSWMSYIQVAMGPRSSSGRAPWLGGQSELGAAPSRKAVWWDLRFANLLTHLCFILSALFSRLHFASR